MATFVGRASVLPGTWKALDATSGASAGDGASGRRGAGADPLPAGRRSGDSPEALSVSAEARDESLAAEVIERRYAGNSAY